MLLFMILQLKCAVKYLWRSSRCCRRTQLGAILRIRHVVHTPHSVYLFSFKVVSLAAFVVYVYVYGLERTSNPGWGQPPRHMLQNGQQLRVWSAKSCAPARTRTCAGGIIEH